MTNKRENSLSTHLRDEGFLECLGLFDYLNRTFRTLCFTCPANQTFAGFAWSGFAVFDFVNADGASVDTSFASSAFRVDNNFYHFCLTSVQYFSQKSSSKIKGFRCFSGFFHVTAARFRLCLILPFHVAFGSHRCFLCILPAKFRLCFAEFPR